VAVRGICAQAIEIIGTVAILFGNLDRSLCLGADVALGCGANIYGVGRRNGWRRRRSTLLEEGILLGWGKQWRSLQDSR
jgi:hypothetical protein